MDTFEDKHTDVCVLTRCALENRCYCTTRCTISIADSTAFVDRLVFNCLSTFTSSTIDDDIRIK